MGVGLNRLTPGMFGYSLTRTHVNSKYFLEILDACNKIGIELEGYHTETGAVFLLYRLILTVLLMFKFLGPGVYEVAIQYSDRKFFNCVQFNLSK